MALVRFASIRSVGILITAAAMLSSTNLAAVAQAPAISDVLVLSNGDTLHAKLVNSSDGKVTSRAELGSFVLFQL